MFRSASTVLIVIVACGSPTTSTAEDNLTLPWNLTLTAMDESRMDATVVFDLPAKLAANELRLVETTDGKDQPVTTQMDHNPDRLYWIAVGELPAGTTRTYRLEKHDRPEVPAIVSDNSDRSLQLSFEQQGFLQYNKAHVEPPAELNPLYGRSAHLHPVKTPKGLLVTDEFPPDHAHQSGIFLAFTKTRFDGQEIDFWNLAGGKGRVRFVEMNAVQTGPLFARFSVDHEHVLFTDEHATSDLGKTGGKIALTETWDVRAWTTGWKSSYWIMDIHSQIRCATDLPLVLPEYHYGGMAIRAARDWVPDKVRFVTSEGADRIQGNHSRPRWCDISGEVGGSPAGITLMTHPSNFRYPEPLRIHPTMPYMVYAPSYLGEWEIRPGSPHSSSYRFLVHDGEFTADTIEKVWRDFAKPLVAARE